ncbi:arylsulfatase [Polynucleobacter sp. MWH-UH2A]|uniref:arylsulfatase n=1 Tax=Polynucleobacter sp. MWH-UH2A TaxID=1855617 RepID=UPI001BFE234F|nr:arylsulfatase [Polynucleobacter sp. MWH-UH2A]QWD63859.1 arylsulfatase [Polynucleobacter sp. MWH-UH2A]
MTSSVIAQTTANTSSKNPNVIFILADNVGYGDLGSYGGGELRGAPTPRSDELAKSGLRLTQYLVEPACTPSRAALMTGQYSIRNGLSLVIIPGSPSTLSGKAYTMGQLFKDAGYSTALYGKWHLGSAPQSLPGAHGFDQFYGIPPDISWDSASLVPQAIQTHSFGDVPDKVLYDKGPWINQQKGNGPLERVKPYTMAVRAEIDNELTDKSIAFMKQQNAAGKPFFLYLPFSMGHYPNLPSKQFAGKSRIGQYGDKMMEGDYHLGQVMDALKEMNIEDNTILVFASDNGSTGQTVMHWDRQGLGAPDMGSNGPFRGDLGEATEGAVRTFCIIRWPGHTAPGSTSNAMFSIMDFMPTFANILGAKLPTDRAIDGVNQLDVLMGKSATGNRESLLSFIGPDLVAARWKQWRIYFKDMNRTGTGQQTVGGLWANSAPLYTPKFYNVEMDPHEDLQLTNYAWIGGPIFKVVEEYLASVKKFPNPPPSNVTNFSQPLSN